METVHRSNWNIEEQVAKDVEETLNKRPIDLHEIIKKMLTRYVEILLEERLKNNFDLLCCIDTNGNFNYTCPNHNQVMGFKTKDLLGLNVFDMIHPDDLENVKQKVLEIIKTKEPLKMRYRLKHIEGNWIKVESICTPYIMDDEVVSLINFSKPR